MALDVRSVSPGEYGQLRLVSGLINFNTAGGAVVLEALKAGDIVVFAWANVIAAFNAGTTNVLVLGDGTTANKFLAAADVAEGTPGPSAVKGPFAPEAAAGNLTATYTQTGTAATTGSARVYALVSSSPA
jgi:hypothetical protein